MCYYNNKHKGHKIINIEDEESLIKENVNLDLSKKELNKINQNIVLFKDKIKNEINKIDNLYDKIFNEVTKRYNELIDTLKNKVTQAKEKLEILWSKLNDLEIKNKRIDKSISIFQNKEKNVLKSLYYISNINKNNKEILSFFENFSQNLIITFEKEKNSIIYKNYFFNAFISETQILNEDNKNILLNFLNPLSKGKNIYLQLIYRRGDDMSCETFHKKSDKQGSTVVICKSKDEIFGGYTNVDWISPDKYITKFENEPFIFSINKNKKFNYTNKEKWSIYLDKGHGSDFYWDFVFNSSEQMKKCYCCTKTYGYAYSSEPLVGDGSYNLIDVDEIEIFKLEIF